jgi:hypothetical protein
LDIGKRRDCIMSILISYSSSNIVKVLSISEHSIYIYYVPLAVILNNSAFSSESVGAFRAIIFWDITPCSLLKVKGGFGGTRSLHLEGLRISQARNVPTKRQLTFNGLHGVISHKIQGRVSK